MLHERVLMVSLVTEDIPIVRSAERASVKALGAGLYQVVARYGFMEKPDVPSLLAGLPPGAIPGPPLDRASMATTYYLGRETLLPTGRSQLARWRKRVFIYLARNAQTASTFFGLPPNRVVELGTQLEL